MTTAPTANRRSDELRESDPPTRQLVDTLAPVLGEGVAIGDLVRLSGGASRETWSFRARVGSAPSIELILRRDPPTRPGLDGSMRLEANAMRAARIAGLQAPHVVVDDDGSTLGTAGLVMERVPGETLARRILRDDEYAPARAVLAAELGQFFAGLHALDPATVPGLIFGNPLVNYRARYALLGEVSVTFEAAFRWLEAHVPEPAGDAVVHGDLRLGNIIVGPEGLRAVIDWELVHRGDPLEDLGWVCVKAWRFGSPLPAAGVGTIDELVTAYEGAGGRPIDRNALHWWLVLNTLKWGVGCMGQASVHLQGMQRSVELAAIGRRVCEQEWDLLLLLAPDACRAALGAEQPVVGPTDPGLHGRPTAVELIDAAREFLTDDVMAATDGRVAFHARVAANVLATVQRELTLGPAQERRHRARLASLGATSDESLAARVADGVFDGRTDELFAALAAAVRDKLAVANPNYAYQ